MSAVSVEKTEKELFSGRDVYIEQLVSQTNSLKKSQHKNIAIFGYKGIGKTTLLKEFLRQSKSKEISQAILNLNNLSLSPESFSVEFIVNVFAQFSERDSLWVSKSLSADGLLEIKKEVSKHSANIIDKIINELEKIKPNQQLILENAFEFAQALAEENEKKAIICIENFDRILDLSSFEKIQDVFSAINLSQKDVLYVVTSSATYQFKPILSKQNFEFIQLANLSKEETRLLVEKTAGRVSSEVADKIYSLTLGYPAYVHAIAESYKETKDVKRAFILETVFKSGRIYSLSEQIILDSLSRARGKTLLNVILNVLSHHEKLRLTDIAKKIFRSAPVTKSLLSRLIEVDIITKSDNLYSINDPVLRYYISRRNSGALGTLSEIDDSLLKKMEDEL